MPPSMHQRAAAAAAGGHAVGEPGLHLHGAENLSWMAAAAAAAAGDDARYRNVNAVAWIALWRE